MGRQGQLGGRDKFRGDTAHALAQYIPHLIHIGQFVHQTEALIVCRVGKSHIAVGIGIESVHRQAARLSHGNHHPLPNVGDEGRHLSTVGFAHPFENERFDCTLVRAHLKHLHLHTELFEKARIEDGLARNTVPVEHARGVEIDLVGHGSHIVAGLRIGVGIGHDELLRFLKLHKGFAQRLERRIVGVKHTALYIDAIDIVVGGRFANGGEVVVEALRGEGAVAHQFGKGIFGIGAVLKRTAQMEVEHTV